MYINVLPPKRSMQGICIGMEYRSKLAEPGMYTYDGRIDLKCPMDFLGFRGFPVRTYPNIITHCMDVHFTSWIVCIWFIHVHPI